MQTIKLHPRDLLFFRDARPMGGSHSGDGASWPIPGVLHSAILSAFHRQWPGGHHQEHTHSHLKPREQRKFSNGKTSLMRFGGLKTIGPFPCKDEQVYFPTPADLTANGWLKPVQTRAGWATDLPAPLKYPVSATTPPSKDKIEPWLSVDELGNYLRGQIPQTTKQQDLFHVEPRPGVGIDPTTHANVDHVFYQAQYLRLEKQVSLAAAVEADARNKNGNADLVDEWFGTLPSRELLLGGQSGVALAERAHMSFMDIAPPPIENRMKWVLLTPAVFGLGQIHGETDFARRPGWLPDWIDAGTGHVLLRPKPEKRQLNVGLVAARIPKPIVFSGWKLDPSANRAGGTPKPTRMAVPAGSVFYFEGEDAPALAAALHGRCKAPYLGEQGFGFGVCASWDFLER